jgi:hypothetical protein
MNATSKLQARRDRIQAAKEAGPYVGQQATHQINCDFYPRVIIAVERNGRTVKTAPVLTRGGGSLFIVPTEAEIAEMMEHSPWKIDTYTKRRDGEFIRKGSKWGRLILGEFYSDQAREF